jgi:hypothetical protein
MQQCKDGDRDGDRGIHEHKDILRRAGHLLNPGEEAMLEFVSIAAQHVAGSALVF